MDGLEGETRGDAAAGLERARATGAWTPGASTTRWLCTEVPAFTDTRDGAGRPLTGAVAAGCPPGTVLGFPAGSERGALAFLRLHGLTTISGPS